MKSAQHRFDAHFRTRTAPYSPFGRSLHSLASIAAWTRCSISDPVRHGANGWHPDLQHRSHGRKPERHDRHHLTANTPAGPARRPAATRAARSAASPTHRASGGNTSTRWTTLQCSARPRGPTRRRQYYPAQAKGAKCALRVPVESSHLIPNTLKRLRVALASDSRLFTGCAVLSTTMHWPEAEALAMPSQA